jgi:LacI family transcriptional regulator
MCEIQQAGIQIPEQVAIVGFNDIPLAELVTPSLTTVAAPAYQMGLEAMKMLQNLILGERPKRQQSLLPTALVIRQSCGCPGGLPPC